MPSQKQPLNGPAMIEVELSLIWLVWGLGGYASIGIIFAIWAGTGKEFLKADDYWISTLAVIPLWPWYIQWLGEVLQENRDKRFKKQIVKYQERFDNAPSPAIVKTIELQSRYSFFQECINVRNAVQE